MRSPKLRQSGVLFNEAEHLYSLNGKQLRGITGILHRKIFTDMYTDVPEDILRKAAEYGSSVHSTIELCDSLEDYDNQDSNYIAYRRLLSEKNLVTFANEYIVTDSENYASAIDVTAIDDKGNIALADIKTTSKLNDEYVSWQLSIYKYLFGILNPKLKKKVTALYAIWLPKKRYGQPTLIQVDEKPEELVKELLRCDLAGEDFAYLPQEAGESELSLSAEYIDNVVSLYKALDTLKQQEEEIKKGLLLAMRESNVKSFKNGKILLTRVIPSDEPSFTLDSARLKEEMPEIYEKYKKEKSPAKESIRVKIY